MTLRNLFSIQAKDYIEKSLRYILLAENSSEFSDFLAGRRNPTFFRMSDEERESLYRAAANRFYYSFFQFFRWYCWEMRWDQKKRKVHPGIGLVLEGGKNHGGLRKTILEKIPPKNIVFTIELVGEEPEREIVRVSKGKLRDWVDILYTRRIHADYHPEAKFTHRHFKTTLDCYRKILRVIEILFQESLRR